MVIFGRGALTYNCFDLSCDTSVPMQAVVQGTAAGLQLEAQRLVASPGDPEILGNLTACSAQHNTATQQVDNDAIASAFEPCSVVYSSLYCVLVDKEAPTQQ
jgi:hypothetical protein